MSIEKEAAAAKKSFKGPKHYWRERKDLVYLLVARTFCRAYCPEPASVLDVGSHGTATLEWHRRDGNQLVSIDLVRPYKAAGVESITADFFTYQTANKFDLVTCFQVLEHVPDAAPFAQKLLELGHVVVVSVPYKWRAGKYANHIHDPVDEAKMLEWFRRVPVESYVAKEPLNAERRLIQVYAGDRLQRWMADGAGSPKASSRQRARRPLLLRVKNRLRKLLD